MNRDGEGARVLFILTHRLGDLLQAFPAFALARKRLPHAELHLLCDEGCVPLARLCPDLDTVHSFPRASLLPGSPTGASRQAETVLDLGAALRRLHFSQVVNLMGNLSAALLGCLAGSEGSGGGGRRFARGGALPVEQRWARLLMALPAARSWQPFHLSELFLRLTAESLGLEAELTPPGLSVDRMRGLELLRKLAPQGDDVGWLALRRPWVGLQGGASKSLRRPPGTWLRTFGREFLGQLGGSLFLLGTSAEAEAFEPLLRSLSTSQRRRCVNACGALDLAALAGVASNLDAVVSVDTFTLHLAAAVDTPVLGLYPGGASPHETGPWGNGHLVLWSEPAGGPCACELDCAADTQCWDRLHPELVAGALGLLLARGETAALKGRRVRAFETTLDRRQFTLRSLDGLREREAPDQALASLARAWALGEPRPEVGLDAPARAAFSALARELGGPAEGLDLGLRRDPGDWFRAQAMQARGDGGLWSHEALRDTAAGCGYFAAGQAQPLSAP